MEAVTEALRQAAEKGLMPPGSAILLAVSGGADSMALLYGAVEAATPTGWKLSVGHVHHGWRGREAERDLAFVAAHARKLHLPFDLRRHDARAEARRLRLSPEAGARYVRYRALAEMAKEAGAAWIATGHQQEDVLESHLLALERKGGLARLAGPREKRSDGVVRPLLAVCRVEILDFLARRGICWRRDSSNGNLRLSRNRVRREVLARLRAERGEGFLRELAERVAELAKDRDRLEREFERTVRPYLTARENLVSADAAFLRKLAPELQRWSIAEMAAPFARPGGSPLTGREREELLRQISSGRNFRFEAGRRIRFERRGRLLEVRPRLFELPLNR